MNVVIKLTPALEKQIKIVIDKYSKSSEKKKGYTEILGWYAKGFLTKGQAHKVESFYNNFNPSDQKDREQKEIYDEVNVLPFCQNSLNHIAQTDKMKAKAKSRANVTQKRTVDRLNKSSLESVKPPKIDYDLVKYNESMFESEKKRIIEIIGKIKDL
ncbi:hypothetical protein [Flavobacterium sp. N2038]|uniref:hypothetical protein n=1 Tax=Flavobacterium sp. N2038 TaxID=2986829 RepID=UPI0022254F25|nr:hypothetical protein [Flavobacterium sp. N2038]